MGKEDDPAKLFAELFGTKEPETIEERLDRLEKVEERVWKVESDLHRLSAIMAREGAARQRQLYAETNAIWRVFLFLGSLALASQLVDWADWPKWTILIVWAVLQALAVSSLSRTEAKQEERINFPDPLNRD